MPHEFTEWEDQPEPLASSAHSGSPPRKLTGIGTLEPTEPPQKNMAWTRRILLATPFAIAVTLNVLVAVADRLHLHREHIVFGYVFVFAAPWVWLLNLGLRWFHLPHNRWLETLLSYAIFLWIPALLYSGCVWLLFFSIAKFRHRTIHTPG